LHAHKKSQWKNTAGRTVLEGSVPVCKIPAHGMQGSIWGRDVASVSAACGG